MGGGPFNVTVLNSVFRRKLLSKKATGNTYLEDELIALYESYSDLNPKMKVLEKVDKKAVKHMAKM